MVVVALALLLARLLSKVLDPMLDVTNTLPAAGAVYSSVTLALLALANDVGCPLKVTTPEPLL